MMKSLLLAVGMSVAGTAGAMQEVVTVSKCPIVSVTLYSHACLEGQAVCPTHGLCCFPVGIQWTRTHEATYWEWRSYTDEQLRYGTPPPITGIFIDGVKHSGPPSGTFWHGLEHEREDNLIEKRQLIWICPRHHLWVEDFPEEQK